MKAYKTRHKLYAVYAAGAAIATASAVAGSIWAFYALIFVIIDQVTMLKGNAVFMVIGVICSLATGIASYRWSFNYFMSQRKDICDSRSGRNF